MSAQHPNCRSHNPAGFCFECFRCEHLSATRTEEQRREFLAMRATMRDHKESQPCDTP